LDHVYDGDQWTRYQNRHEQGDDKYDGEKAQINKINN
jgi:hypothetical protein